MKKRMVAFLVSLVFMLATVGVVYANASTDITYPEVQSSCCVVEYEEVIPLNPPSWENGGGDGGRPIPPPTRCCPGMCCCGRVIPSFSCSC